MFCLHVVVLMFACALARSLSLSHSKLSKGLALGEDYSEIYDISLQTDLKKSGSQMM